jgi:hypothetical protein
MKKINEGGSGILKTVDSVKTNAGAIAASLGLHGGIGGLLWAQNNKDKPPVDQKTQQNNKDNKSQVVQSPDVSAKARSDFAKIDPRLSTNQSTTKFTPGGDNKRSFDPNAEARKNAGRPGYDEVGNPLKKKSDEPTVKTVDKKIKKDTDVVRTDSGPRPKPIVTYPTGADEITKQRLDQERRIKNLTHSGETSQELNPATMEPFTSAELEARAELAKILKNADIVPSEVKSEPVGVIEPGPDFIDRTVKKADEPIANVELPSRQVGQGNADDTEDQKAEWDKLYTVNEELNRIKKLSGLK